VVKRQSFAPSLEVVAQPHSDGGDTRDRQRPLPGGCWQVTVPLGLEPPRNFASRLPGIPREQITPKQSVMQLSQFVRPHPREALEINRFLESGTNNSKVGVHETTP
jgi:hypothetical protein